MQHVLAMFGATVLVPILTGLPVSTTLLFSGIGTLLFLALTKNRVPSYLGSSFAFVAPLTAAAQDGVAAQLGGVLAAGAVLLGLGVAVKALGVRVLESFLPPVVTGAIVVLVALNLAPTATSSFGEQPAVAALTLLVVLLCAACSRGMLGRLSVLAGMLTGWAFAAGTGAIDRAAVDAMLAAPWFGLPDLHAPVLRPSVVLLFVPVVVVLVAENVGHVKAVAAMTGRNLDGSIGDTVIANGVATTLAGLGGGSGTTTYAQNIGVMAVTRVFSTAACAVAALAAVLLAFLPKFGALINTVPAGVLGGVTIVLLGMIAMVGVRIWLASQVDLTDPVNLLVAGTAVVAGVGDLTLAVGSTELGGIAWGSAFIVIAYPILRRLSALRTRLVTRTRG